MGSAVKDGEPRRGLWSLSQSTPEKRPVKGTYRYPNPAASGHCSALLSLENNRPELGTYRLPAVMRRGRRGTEERCGVGEKLPSRAHFWSSLYSYRPILLSPATIPLQGKKLLCTKNKCDPCARIRRGSRGEGQRALPGPARLGHTGASKAPNLPWQRKMEKSPFSRRSSAAEPGPEWGRPGTKPAGPESRPEAGWMSSPPRAEGRCGAQLLDFTWGFSFANQFSVRLSSAETRGAARSVHFLPTPGPDLFHPRKVPAQWSWHGGARPALAVPLWGREEWERLSWGESPARRKRIGVKEIGEPVTPTSRFRVQMEKNDRGGSTTPATSSPCEGSHGAFPIAGEKRRGAPIPNVRNQCIFAPLSTAAGPSRPTTPGGF